MKKMNGDEIRKRWLSQYYNIAETMVMISHYEDMLEAWEREHDGVWRDMKREDESDYAYEQEENGVPRYEEFQQMTIDSQGGYAHVDYDQLVDKSSIAHFLQMDARILLRKIKEEEE